MRQPTILETGIIIMSMLVVFWTPLCYLCYKQKLCLYNRDGYEKQEDVEQL